MSSHDTRELSCPGFFLSSSQPQVLNTYSFAVVSMLKFSLFALVEAEMMKKTGWTAATSWYCILMSLMHVSCILDLFLMYLV